MDAGEWIESFIRGFMCLLGILGNNWLVVRSIPSKKSQIRTNEVLFINLAVSNLITNVFVDMPDTMADFADEWFLGRTYCAIFQFCSDLSATSSIISTMLITVFWHQKLVGSLSRGTAPVRLDSLRLVAALLAGGWAVAVVFSAPHFYFVSLDADNGSSDDCEETFPSPVARQTYEAMYLTLANALPIAGMVFSSIQIVITLLRHQARIVAMNAEAHGGASNKDAPPGDAPPAREPSKDAGGSSDPAVPPQGAVQPRPNKAAAGPSNQVRAAKSVVAVASVFLVCWLTHMVLRISSNVHESSLVVEVASYIAASYTCIIPYIFLYGVKKLTCSCRG